MVGGGILGAAVARRLQQVDEDADVVLWEKEPRLAAHQTGRNSGVVHAGLYYEPGSLKATLCRRGVGLLRDFCAEHDVAYDACGKVVVALDELERGRLAGIEQRALANGVPGIRTVGPGELSELEPHVTGVAALHSPETAIVDYVGVTEALARLVEEHGGRVHLGREMTDLVTEPTAVVLHGRDAAGPVEQRVDRVLLCTGVWSDRTARLAGDDAAPQVVPFRGEYHLLRPERRSLVRGLVYPVPDPRYPFLGVHLTPRVDGEVMVGPNVVLALAREGYAWRTASWRDLREVAAYDGFRRFARQHWRTGVAEMAGSLSTRRFVAAARRYVPDLRTDDVLPGTAGIRAQALDRDGSLVDDFRVSTYGRVTALRNAPSPAATSSLAIAEHVVDLVQGRDPERRLPAP
ncbi:L-2-hydroxyglutarate oxidase [Nocardioides marmoraquaticus]